ncbi:hypothetical protein ABPG72_011503 [Tetrahymena utriculariae]
MSQLQIDINNLNQQQKNLINIPKQINTLQKNQITQNDQLNKVNSLIQLQQNQTSNLQDQINILFSQILNTTDLNLKISQLQSDVNNLNQQQKTFVNVLQQINTIQLNQTTQNIQLNNMNIQIQSQQNQTSNIQGQINSLILNTTDVSQKISQVQSDVNNLNQQQKTFVNIPQQIYTLQQNQSIQNTQLFNMSNLIQLQQIQISHLQDQINSSISKVQNTTDVHQTISQLQQNINNLNSSLIQVNQSMPVTTIYQITSIKKWQNDFSAPSPEGIIIPELSQVLEIKTKSLVKMNLRGVYKNNRNRIFISFSINQTPISEYYQDGQFTVYWGPYFNDANFWAPLQLSQMKILESGIYTIQLIAVTQYTNGNALTIDAPVLDIEVQTLPKKS